MKLFLLCTNTDLQRACLPKPRRRQDSSFIPRSRDLADVLAPACLPAGPP